ncbi:alanine racemase [Enterococcus sp. DIV0187]|uniref:alanine racemase n=1 Tax=Enterococcus sp. DIV0187 TaxID=2774644 RepID=UPI003F29CFD2
MNDKKNRTWIEVNLDNLIHNFMISQERAQFKPTMCIIKADAYGQGAVAVAKALSGAGASYFGVATAEEALQLRRHQITEDILLLGTTSPNNIEELIDADITVTVSSEKVAESFSLVQRNCNKKLKIHIKIDSGMGRQGICLDHAVEQVLRISEFSGFEVEGIYSHFAAADDSLEDDFTKHQYESMLQIVRTVRNLGVNIPIFHISNSAGIISQAYRDTDMVRPGIMLYGSNPCTDFPVDLKPVMSLKSRVSNIIHIKKGDTVGYGRNWKADEDSVIAVLGIGYADGLMRNLSGKLSVLIDGKRMPQVGRICMDMCMIDVTNLKGIEIGDIVTIIGKDGDEENTVDKVAELSNTISYEILCAIGKRVPRIYLKDQQKIMDACYIDLL